MPVFLTDHQPGQFEQMGREVDQRLTELEAQVVALTPPDFHVWAVGAAGEAVLSWSEVPGSLAYVVGRDGTDTRNGGPVFFVEGASSRQRRFIWLSQNVVYHLYATAIPSGATQSVEMVV
jgi:hypothetical protein